LTERSGASPTVGLISCYFTLFDDQMPAGFRQDREAVVRRYAELLGRLTRHDPGTVPDALRQNINAFYAAAPSRMSDRKERKRATKIREQLTALNSKTNVQR